MVWTAAVKAGSNKHSPAFSSRTLLSTPSRHRTEPAVHFAETSQSQCRSFKNLSMEQAAAFSQYPIHRRRPRPFAMNSERIDTCLPIRPAVFLSVKLGEYSFSEAKA